MLRYVYGVGHGVSVCFGEVNGESMYVIKSQTKGKTCAGCGLGSISTH